MNKIPFEEINAGDIRLFVAGKNSGEKYIDLAQKLRYKIFHDEIGANNLPKELIEKQKDYDQMDEFCDHLIAYDQKHNKVVGTYRLLRGAVAEKTGRFYSEDEFDIMPVMKRFKENGKEVLELSRACVDMEYRDKAIIQLLWAGVAKYASFYDVSIFFGCGSFKGTDVKKIEKQLAYLYYNHLARDEMRIKPQAHRHVKMDNISKEEIDANEKEILVGMPALMKGYMRIGADVGDGAVQDFIYNTTDVMITVEVNRMQEKYHNHLFGNNEIKL